MSFSREIQAGKFNTWKLCLASDVFNKKCLTISLILVGTSLTVVLLSLAIYWKSDSDNPLQEISISNEGILKHTVLRYDGTFCL